MKAAPWVRLPGSAANSAPSRTSRLSTASAVISGSGPDQSPARRVPVRRPSPSNPVSLSVRSVPVMMLRAPGAFRATG